MDKSPQDSLSSVLVSCWEHCLSFACCSCHQSANWFNNKLKCCNQCLNTVRSLWLNICVKLSPVTYYLCSCAYPFTFDHVFLCFTHIFAWCDSLHSLVIPVTFVTLLTCDSLLPAYVYLMLCKLCMISKIALCLFRTWMHKLLSANPKCVHG